jgi:myo-inositol 2-dehydrogenase/D-chiro-inositol 1-dehydrogenase
MASSDNTHRFNSVLATDEGFRRPPLEDFFLERYARSYLDQWAAFVDMVTSGGPSPASGADGRAPLVIGMAALRSLNEHRPVTIEEVDE